MKLQTKFLLFSLPLALIFGGFIPLFVKKAIKSVIVHNIYQLEISVARDFSNEVEPAFRSGKESKILPYLQASREKAGAVYAMALNLEGKVLAHTNVGETGKIYDDPATRHALKSATVSSRQSMVDGVPLLELFFPVWKSSGDSFTDSFLLAGDDARPSKDIRGVFRMGVPLTNAFRTVDKIFTRILWINAAACALIFGAAFLFLRRILWPVRLLIHGTEKIGKGEYGTCIDVCSSDELGRLAGSFNKMSKDLSATTVSKNFLARIMDSMLDPLIVTDEEGRVRMVNPVATRLWEASEEDMKRETIASLFVDGEKAFNQDGLENIRQRGSIRDLELNLLKRDKVEVCVHVSVVCLMDEDGHPSGFIVVARDMTERKKMEARMISSEKLSAVGQLAAGVAHEINNPLGIILGFSQGLAGKISQGDPMNLPVTSILREATRCKNLVQDLLTYSRSSRSERVPMDLAQAVAEAISLISVQSKIKQVEVRQECPAGLPRILGNKNQIQQIIINLANNALDAMPNGGILLIKTERRQESPQAWVVLTIRDTGPGIPPEVLPRIFEPFYTTKEVGQGTGLGLSMVYEIVKKHSGMVDVESRPGFTEFRIKFPVKTQKELHREALEERNRLMVHQPAKRFN